MDVAVRTVVFVVGALAVLGTIGSAVRTVVLPRAVPARLGTIVFVNIRRVYDLRLRRTPTYEQRDRVMAGFAPSALLTLVFVWLAVTLAGYTAMYWALGTGIRQAFTFSGSSILTLGFREPADLPAIVVALTEAAIGLTLLALLITYLPSLYAAFSRRERSVALLEVRASTPPFGATMIERYARIEWLGGLAGIWEQWESWFVELEESHTSFPSLVFFRSPQPDHSWITAAGAVLDAAALSASTLETRDPDAQLCLRAGYLALQRIAAFFAIPYDADPSPDDPITVSRDEFDAVYDRLASLEIPLQPDRDQAWRDFAGWRVNYDVPLVTLCTLVMAPYAPWSSDRSVPRYRVKVIERFRRQRRDRPDRQTGS